MDIIKREISYRINVVDKGQAKKFLCIGIERNSSTGEISIHQRSYIEGLLEEYGMMECRTVSTPLEVNYQVACEKTDCKKVNSAEYQSLIGSLMHSAICTRPDILHSVCKLSQRNSDPHYEHLSAAKRILNYLSKTKNIKIHFSKSEEPLKCFVDADWGGDSSNRRSYTGYTFMLAGGTFSWESKKQDTIALSSTEAEYMALSSACKEAVYLRRLLHEIGLYCPDKIEINGDNLGAIHLVKNPVYHNRTKHIDIRYHHIRDVFENGLIDLKYCPSNENVADVLTKNLSKVNHVKCVTYLGLQ